MTNNEYKNTLYIKVFSGESGYASNNGETITESFEIGEQKDNAFVQHAIPRSDFQYAWVTASVLGEYRSELPNGYADDENWLDGRMVVSSSTINPFRDLAGQPLEQENVKNYKLFLPTGNDLSWVQVIYDPIRIADHTVSLHPLTGGPYESLGISRLRSENTNYTNFTYYINGPWANPTFIRGDSHPVTIAHRREARIDVMNTPRVVIGSNGAPVNERLNPNITTYREALVDNDSRALIHTIRAKNFDNGQIISEPSQYEYEFSSKRTFFNHSELDRFADFDKPNIKEYDAFVEGYGNQDTPVDKFVSIKLSQGIWPKKKNKYLAKIRKRPDFKFNWKKERLDREIISTKYTSYFDPDAGALFVTAEPAPFPNTQNALDGFLGGSYLTASIWPLDGRPVIGGEKRESSLLTTSSTRIHNDCGELNSPAMWWWINSFMNLRLGASFHWHQHTDPTSYGVFFSTDSEFTVDQTTGVEPFEDTHAEWAEHTFAKAKDMSQLPEFRISEHMDRYVLDFNGNFLADESPFSVTGSVVPDSNDDQFFEVYNSSDIIRDLGKIRKDHQGYGAPTKLELTAKALMKFTPYQGFYPVERTMQLAALFSASVSDKFVADSAFFQEEELDVLGMRPILHAMFAPGIVYNSIKSGVSVGWKTFSETKYEGFTYGAIVIDPSQTNDVLSQNYFLQNYNIGPIRNFEYEDGFKLSDALKSIPFEAAVDNSLLKNVSMIDMHQHPSGSLDLTSSIQDTDPRYTLAANNFFAESTNFFLKNRNMSSIVSADDNNESYYQMQLNKEYRMRVYLNNCDVLDEISFFEKCKNFSDHIWTPRGLSWDTGSLLLFAHTALVATGSHKLIGMNVETVIKENFSFDDIIDVESEITTFSGADVYCFSGSYRHDGSSFGPAACGPLDYIEVDVGQVNTSRDSVFGAAEYSYYTPSYFNGISFCEITFKPFDEAGDVVDSTRKRRFTLDEILGQSKVSYFRFSDNNTINQYFEYINKDYIDSTPILGEYEFELTGSNYFATFKSSLSTNKMHINDSVNLFDVVRNKELEYTPEGNPVFVKDSSTAGNRWVIYPKWECPIYDYKNVEKTYSASGSLHDTKGIWHDYGQDVIGNGVHLQVADIPDRKFVTPYVPGALAPVTGQLIAVDKVLTGSLADVVGFPKTPVKLGRTADKTRVEEAIVAIPFLENNGIRNFIQINPDAIRRAKNNFVTLENGDRIGKSVIDMVKAMKKFVIPPQFDFLTFDGSEGKPVVDPIVMYIMPFSYEFDREDLKRIWHNVSPKTVMKEASVTLGHELMEGELLSSIIDDKMKWLVFKVKQKAEWSYWSKTFTTKDDDRFRFDFQGNDIKKAPEYSYNWPYDFFSVLDMAKLEAGVLIESDEARDFRRLQNNLEDLPVQPVSALSEVDLRTFSETMIKPLIPPTLVELEPILEFPPAPVFMPAVEQSTIPTRRTLELTQTTEEPQQNIFDRRTVVKTPKQKRWK